MIYNCIKSYLIHILQVRNLLFMDLNRFLKEKMKIVSTYTMGSASVLNEFFVTERQTFYVPAEWF